ncbi:MAG: hypothetical protein JNL96_22425 [Planctomycetaceae bacterium]|nr:hypothetical protein [Planctomycetaceae bacterium]
MKSKLFCAFALAALGTICSVASAEEAVRNYGSTQLESAVQAENSAAPTYVAFGHHRRGCCGATPSYGAGYGLTPALYSGYSTYQPYAAYTSYYPGAGAYRYMTPNPYGYYQNGWIWGSSGSTYGRPFPVWNSPSGVYDYRYLGWGGYGWGGWGGTGPAGWGYQGGFYW